MPAPWCSEWTRSQLSARREEVWRLARAARPWRTGPDLGGARNSRSTGIAAVTIPGVECRQEFHAIQWRSWTNPFCRAGMAAGPEREVMNKLGRKFHLRTLALCEQCAWA